MIALLRGLWPLPIVEGSPDRPATWVHRTHRDYPTVEPFQVGRVVVTTRGTRRLLLVRWLQTVDPYRAMAYYNQLLWVELRRDGTLVVRVAIPTRGMLSVTCRAAVLWRASWSDWRGP